MGKEEWEASYGKEGEALYRERGEALYGKGIGGGLEGGRDCSLQECIST